MFTLAAGISTMRRAADDGARSAVAASAGDPGGMDAWLWCGTPAVVWQSGGVGGLGFERALLPVPGRLVISSLGRQAMADVKSLEHAVEALDPSALAEFRRWFAEFDASAWYRQLETDAAAGKHDALLAEAEDDYRNVPHRQL